MKIIKLLKSILPSMMCLFLWAEKIKISVSKFLSFLELHLEGGLRRIYFVIVSLNIFKNNIENIELTPFFLISLVICQKQTKKTIKPTKKRNF